MSQKNCYNKKYLLLMKYLNIANHGAELILAHS